MINKRYQSLDLIRAVACFYVILLHTAAQSFYNIDSNNWFVCILYDAISRCCVPMFLMISGALLIRSESINIFFKKRFSRIVPPILFWGVFYKSIGTDKFNFDIFSSVSCYHLWYLYALVGLYLLIPLLARWYLNSSKAEILFYISLWMLLLLLCEFKNFIPMANIYYLTSFISLSGYFILGAYIKDIQKYISLKVKYFSLFLYIFFSALICILTIYYSKIHHTPIEHYFEYLNVFVVFQSISLFIFLFKINYKPQSSLFMAE